MLPFGANRRLNSVRWRFAIAIALLTFVGMLLRDAAFIHLDVDAPWRLLSLLALSAGVGAVTFWLASQLTGLVVAMRRSTEAAAAGEFDAPVDVHCISEMGGLAHSLRKLSSRLNANLRRINTLSHTDAITGLPNRTVVEHVLARAAGPALAGEFRAAMLFIGLDGLKQVNNTLGHDAGDELLRLASQRLLVQGLQRGTETVETCLNAQGQLCDRLPADRMLAHFAGEEFVAILPGSHDQPSLAALGQRLVNALGEPFRLNSQLLRISANVGIAAAPEDTCNTSELLVFAAQAMRSAKQGGKLSCAFFCKQSHAGALALARTEGELLQALARRELVMVYQPKVDMRTCELRGVEALVRWRHPERGLLAPREFIEVAERGGHMAVLGGQVLEMAVAQCRAWLDAGLRLVVAVNVSPSQFTDPHFVDQVLGALRAAGVPPDLLMIEITESLAMTDFDATASRLGRLREAGVQVALDDFGIGYSNLSLLSLLPLDVLKIDRSLVQGIGQLSKSEAIIGAIVGMTRALGCRSIAEGIETAEQFDFLRRHGCDCGQGFLFAQPVPPEEVGQWRYAVPPPAPVQATPANAAL
jgi:predicted signal transduction protein with EAL and GGDEF domain